MMVLTVSVHTMTHRKCQIRTGGIVIENRQKLLPIATGELGNLKLDCKFLLDKRIHADKV